MTLDVTTMDVKTSSGVVSGVRRQGVGAWLGVPYAAPPVGRLRFREPQPVTPWTGTRPATRFGGASLQVVPFGRTTQLGAGIGEDCLYLNIWSPGADDARRPVFVWIHGGAYTGGSGALYDGAHLAALGDIVVVTVNYRLGVLGFVDLPGVCDLEAPTNLGLRDVLAALAWVRESIAAFGGDPERVTVGGESAGSVLTSLLMTSSAARGLFSAAVLQSGGVTLTHGERTRREVAQRYLSELGLGSRCADDLRALPAGRLLAAQRAVDRGIHGTTPAGPWLDGDLVPGDLDAALTAVRPDLPVLLGCTGDEITLFQLGPGDILPTSRSALETRLAAALGDAGASRVLAAYPPGRAGTRALGTDLSFAMPTTNTADRHAAAGGSTWRYLLDAPRPVVGTPHAADLPYLWNWPGLPGLLLRGPLTSGRAALAARMQQHWVSFVRRGRPGPTWPQYSLPARPVLVMRPEGDRVVADPDGPRRQAWEGRDISPRS